MSEKQFYKEKIIDMVNSINNLSVLEWLYHFITDGVNNRWV